MENLTKQQIVLVTLLVSFVTSIATGIVTVSLMDQAPTGVTQTINRVIERTIEKVIQTPAQSASVVIRETVVVKEDDQVVTAVEKNSPSVVRLVWGNQDASSIIAFGAILTKEGIFVVDANNTLTDTTYSARLFDDSVYPAERIYNAVDQGLVLFKIILKKDEQKTFVPVTLADSDTLKLGQTVVLITGRESNSVETGLISNLRMEKSKPITQATTTIQTSAPHVASFTTNLSTMNLAGGIVTNLSGEVVGFSMSANLGRFLPSNQLTESLKAYTVWLKEVSESNKTQ